MLAATALLPAPAHAHDTLISSDPADGATLEVQPDAITLTYSADVLEVSPVVRIVDESGETLTEVTPTIDGPTVTAPVEEPLPAGTHTVQWRVVSSDGHPIEGTFTITVEQGADEAAGPSDAGGTAGDAGGAGASDSGGAEETTPAATAEADEETPSEGESSSMPLLLGVVGVAVVGVAIAAFFALRKRT